jgi:hypothetical protein
LRSYRDELEADFQQYYNLDLIDMMESPRGMFRAARLAFQMPKESRYVSKLDPSIQWSWQDSYLMFMSYSLRQLVWVKSKDSQRKPPRNAPELMGPQFILKAMKDAEKNTKQLGSRKHIPDAQTMTSDELDRILKKPRKSVSV